MAKMSALQQEIAKVEQEIGVLEQVKNRVATGRLDDITSELNVLSAVHDRLVAALPPVKTRAPRKKSEVTSGAGKATAKGKGATA